MNRYSNYTPSAYSPMTMQEIMIVPLAKREQHNKAQQEISAQQAELDKINALPVHTEEAKQRKNYLISRIDALSSDLANQGFNNVTTNNILKLNREVRDEFSPQGRLGQINNAYSTYFKNYEDFKKSNEDKKWSQQELNLNWNKHLNNYKGYDEQGNIISIDSLSAPDKVTIENKWKELSAIMGDSKIARDILTGDAQLVSGPNGSLVTITTKDGKKVSYNNPQVVSALNQIHNELNDPTSGLSQSRIYAGQTVENALNEAKNLALSKIDTSFGQTTTVDKDVSGYKNTLDLQNEIGGVGIVDTEETPLHNTDSYGQNKIKLSSFENKIKQGKPLTDDEKEQYVLAKGMQYNYNEAIKDGSIGDKLTKNGKTLGVHYATELGIPGKSVKFKYVSDLYDKSKNLFLSKFKKGTKEYEIAQARINNDLGRISQEVGSYAGASAKSKELEKVDAVFSRIVGKKQKIYHSFKNDIFNKTNSYSNFYNVVTSDSESKTGKKFSILSNILSDAVKSHSAENTVGNISAVTDSEGNTHRLANMKDVSTTRRNIIKVMRSAKEIKPVSFSDNDGGFPAIKLMITPNTDDTSSETIKDSQKLGDGFFGNAEIGNGKPFEVVLRLGDFSNIQNSKNKYGTNSAAIEILKTMIQTGDAQTKTFAIKALERIQQMNKI